MMWKVTVCCWQETPSNFLVVERWSHCSKTQNETSTGRLSVIFVDAVTRKICIFFCTSFVAMASFHRRRNDLEAATRYRCVANFLVTLITNRKVRSSFATVVFFSERTLTPLAGDKYFLFWFFKTFLWQYWGFDTKKFLLNLFFV